MTQAFVPLWVVDERAPDVGHCIPHARVGVVLVPVQLGHQLCNVRLQLLARQLCYGRKSARHREIISGSKARTGILSPFSGKGTSESAGAADPSN